MLKRIERLHWSIKIGAFLGAILVARAVGFALGATLVYLGII